MNKYYRGEKFVIEVEEVHTHYDDKKNPYPLYRIKGFKSLVFDENGLDKLQALPLCNEDDYDEGYRDGYSHACKNIVGYIEGYKDGK